MVDCLKEYKEHFSAAVGLGVGPGGGNSPGDEIGGSAQPAQIGSEELEQFDEISSLLFELLGKLCEPILFQKIKSLIKTYTAKSVSHLPAKISYLPELPVMQSFFSISPLWKLFYGQLC